MKCVNILVILLHINRVYGYFLTTCSSQKNNIEKEPLNKTEEIPSPILYRDVESIFRVLGAPQNKNVTGVRELLQYYDDAKKKKEQLDTLNNVKKHPLIVLEGLSASGKTTVALGLQKKINGTHYHSPPEHLDHLKHLFDHNINLSSAFTFLGQYIASYDVQTLLTKTPVILDRYWYSSAAFAIAYTVNNFPDEYIIPSKGSKIYNWPSDLLKPDVVFFLEVDEAIRELRLSRRNNLTQETSTNNLDGFISKCPQFLKNLMIVYKNMKNPKVVLINANGSIEDVLEDVYTKIKQLLII